MGSPDILFELLYSPSLYNKLKPDNSKAWIMSSNGPRKSNITQIYSLKSPRAPFAMTPGDLLIEIALFLETRLDILNFCFTVRPFGFRRSCSTEWYQLPVTICLLECFPRPLWDRRTAVCWTVLCYPRDATTTLRHCPACASACYQTASKVSQPFHCFG